MKFTGYTYEPDASPWINKTESGLMAPIYFLLFLEMLMCLGTFGLLNRAASAEATIEGKLPTMVIRPTEPDLGVSEPALPDPEVPYVVSCPGGWTPEGPFCTVVAVVQPYTTCPDYKERFVKGLRSTMTAIEPGVCGVTDVTGAQVSCPQGFELQIVDTTTDSAIYNEIHGSQRKKKKGDIDQDAAETYACVNVDIAPLQLFQNGKCPPGYQTAEMGCIATRKLPPSLKCPEGFEIGGELINAFTLTGRTTVSCGKLQYIKGELWCPSGFTLINEPFMRTRKGEKINEAASVKFDEPLGWHPLEEEQDSPSSPMYSEGRTLFQEIPTLFHEKELWDSFHHHNTSRSALEEIITSTPARDTRNLWRNFGPYIDMQKNESTGTRSRYKSQEFDFRAHKGADEPFFNLSRISIGLETNTQAEGVPTKDPEAYQVTNPKNIFIGYLSQEGSITNAATAKKKPSIIENSFEKAPPSANKEEIWGSSRTANYERGSLDAKVNSVPAKTRDSTQERKDYCIHDMHDGGYYRSDCHYAKRQKAFDDMLETLKEGGTPVNEEFLSGDSSTKSPVKKQWSTLTDENLHQSQHGGEHTRKMQGIKRKLEDASQFRQVQPPATCEQFVAVFAANCNTYSCQTPYLAELNRTIRNWIYYKLDGDPDEATSIIPNNAARE